jgi:mRNA-degrading endonuclease toxin of MazEF toxin-antitoxin module
MVVQRFDEMNAHIATVIIAPMTTKGRSYPTRVCRAHFRESRVKWCSISFARWTRRAW